SRQSQKVSFPFPTPHHCRPGRGSPKPHPRWWISLRPRKLLCCRSGGLNLAQAVVERLEHAQGSPLELASLAGKGHDGLAVGWRKRREVQLLDLEGRRGNQFGRALLVALLE